MSTDEERPATPDEPDPNSSPFEVGAVAGIPFGDDSEEARAIERILAQAARERAAAAARAS